MTLHACLQASRNRLVWEVLIYKGSTDCHYVWAAKAHYSTIHACDTLASMTRWLAACSSSTKLGFDTAGSQ